MKKYLVFLLLPLLLSDCTKNNNPVSPATSGIALYLLDDSSITIEQALKSDLNSLALQSQPWLSSEDISLYDFSTHFLYLKAQKSTYFDKVENSQNLAYLPFVFMADNSRIYVGALNVLSVASIPPCPVINNCSLPDDYFPGDVLWLVCPLKPTNDNSIFENEKIKNALIKSSVYHAGLAIQLDSVLIVENSDTSTVKYTFTIKNNDQDNLYILDPNLMGSELFHCYTSGAVFWNENEESTWARYRPKQSPDSLGFWEPAWFVKLSSNTSLQRTVVLKGYPRIENGSYTCNLQFGGFFKIELNARTRSGGRYWLGYILSGKIAVEVP